MTELTGQILSEEMVGQVLSEEKLEGTLSDKGYTTDYRILNKKPSINDVELVGNKTLAELGIADARDLVVANSRINAFTALAEGSTTGDAELMDIRVGYNGKTYESAGTAVREQVADVQEALFGQRTEFLVDPDVWESLIDKSGTGLWISNKKYRHGTVKGVSVYILGDTAQDFDVRFYKDNGDGTATFYAGVTGSGVGVVNVSCDIYIDTDFYVGLEAPNGAYGKFTSDVYFTRTISGTTATIPNTSGNKFYHAYALHMESIADEKVDTDVLEKTVDEIYNRTVKTAETTIRTGTEYADVAALPPNRIYSIHNDVNPASFGLPAKGYGTLLKYRPYTDDKGATGYDVYDFTVLTSNSTERYYTYGLTGHTADSLVWGRIGTDQNTLKVAETIIRYGTEYADVIALPCNRIFCIHNDVDPETFGLPTKGYGTLLKYRPYVDSTADVGYVVYEYTVYRSGIEFEKYFAFTVGGTTKDTIVWKKYNTTPAVPGIKMLGLEEKSIIFIGDSIVEGVGSSDYNGGENGTSGHLIANNVKTYYRNTGTKCWANQMIAYLEEHYPGVTACNNGIGGFNVSNVYNNLETLTLDDNGNRADVVVLSVGTNARRYDDKYGTITTVMRKIINWLLVRNIQPIVLTNTPLIATSDTNNVDNEKNLRGVRSAIMQACEESGVHCYDLLGDFYYYLWDHNMEVSTSTIMADALHPNDAGYEIMFHLIKRIMKV